MPQPRSGGSRSSSGARSKSRSSASRSTSSSRGKRSSGGRRTTSRSTSSAQSRQRSAATGGADARFEAIAQRIRKLNERIIEAGREAGETTLTNYEKALKMIASTLEKGPGSSDVEWVANLATAQAKFIRDVTTSWTAAARKVLK